MNAQTITITHLGYAYCAQCAAQGITNSPHSATPDYPIAECAPSDVDGEACDRCDSPLEA